MSLKKLTFLIFFLFSFAESEGLKLLAKKGNLLQYEFTPSYSEKSVLIENEEFKIPLFKNCSAQQQSDSGKFDLRFFTFPIEVNSELGNVIEIKDTEFETIKNFKLATVPIIYFENSKLKKKFVKFANKTLEKNLVEISKVFKYQNKIFAMVKISPFNIDENKNLSRVKKITFNILLNNKQEVTKKLFSQNSIFSTGQWWKFNIVEDGIYKIDAQFLKNIGINSTTLNSIYDISIFGSNGKIINKNFSLKDQFENLQIPLKYFDINGNNIFNDEDYIIFYAKSVTGWDYSANDKSFSHYTNPYTNSNSYFLRILPQQNPKVISEKKLLFDTQNSISKVNGKIYFDEEKINLTQSGLEWISSPMNPGDTKIYSAKLNGFEQNSQISYKIKVLSRANVFANFAIDESGKNISNVDVYSMTDEELNGDPIGEYAKTATAKFSTIANLTDSRSVLKMTYKANSDVANGYIDYVEIFHNQNLIANNDQIIFTSIDTIGVVKYSINGFSKNSILIFDVTDIFNVSDIIEEADLIQGKFYFVDEHSTKSIKDYFIGTVESAKSISNATKIPNFNLRQNSLNAELIIITPSSFLSEAKRLKTHKENLPVSNKISTTVVEIDSIFNEFSFGLPDPLAIRNFLFFANSNWTIKPKHVLLFGDASYDFKDILKIDKNYIPTYETENSNVQIATYNYDDIFISLDTNHFDKLSLGIGRAPIKSTTDAKIFVDKIIKYETASTKSDWKNLITIVSDDRNVNDKIDGAPNEDQSETLAEIYVPKSYNLKKIFIGDYPTQLTSSGRRKPLAKESIIEQLNSGTLVMNYIGHGNPKVWAHERIFTIDDTEAEYENFNNLPFIVAATCDWGRFDEAGESSSAEEIVLNSSGGAIAVLSATRVVFSGDNASTNYMIYKYLFPTNQFAPIPRIGDAISFAKNDPSSGSLDNNQKYHLLGDPSLKLLVPKLVFQVDSINGKKVNQNLKDTLKPLSKIRITGNVVDANNFILNNISGSGLLSIYDGSQNKTITELGIDFNFLQTGSTIFRGESSIKNGKLISEFIVPKDISYEKNSGKLSLYFSTDSSDGRGFSTNLIIGGEAVGEANDKIGPEINLYFDNKNFKSGDLVSSNPKLYIELFDSSGINSTGSGIGHRIEGWLDNNTSSIDFTPYYKGKIDTYKEGTIEYNFNEITSGEHFLKIKAWDSFNNSSTNEIKFKVLNNEEIAIRNIFAMPNPMKNITYFTFQQNHSSPVDVKIKIYTVAGRLIKTIEQNLISDHFIKIFWDGNDSNGDVVGNGVYLYNVEVSSNEDNYSDSEIGKLVIAK